MQNMVAGLLLEKVQGASFRLFPQLPDAIGGGAGYFDVIVNVKKNRHKQEVCHSRWVERKKAS